MSNWLVAAQESQRDQWMGNSSRSQVPGTGSQSLTNEISCKAHTLNINRCNLWLSRTMLVLFLLFQTLPFISSAWRSIRKYFANQSNAINWSEFRKYKIRIFDYFGLSLRNSLIDWNRTHQSSELELLLLMCSTWIWSHMIRNILLITSRLYGV